MDYREILRTEFLNRRGNDTFYSLRKFAKDLDLTPQHLSLIMKGERGLSKAKAYFIAKQLRLKPFEIQAFLFLVSSQSARALTTRKLAQMGLRKSHLVKANEELKRRSQNGLPPLKPITKKQSLRRIVVSLPKSNAGA